MHVRADALEAFREETRNWLTANAPASMRTPLAPGEEACWGGKKEKRSPDAQRWLELNVERGWTAPTWPRAYGGGGLSKAEAKVLTEEMNALGLRPPLVGFGLSMIGPLLLQEGSEELRRLHLPPIVRGEIRWCQGYSEPGAGSDLASLQTKAVCEGDDYVIDGSKIWTSYAEKADWMFLLVRTDPTAKKQHGITFVLMDMTSPGVTVKPIRLISGASPFCETFLSGVRVPMKNVVGHENQGWAIARALLAHERTMIGDVFKEQGDADKLIAAARDHLGDDGGRLADPLLRDRIAALEIEQACLDLTMQRAKDSARSGQKPGHESSIFKLAGTELNQRRRDLYCAILGPQALGWEDQPGAGSAGFEAFELKATRDWLRSRGNTIEGGTSEIQLDIIAKRVLGLPDAREASTKKEGA
ncbi:MAG: Acyl-CoA dehydrogenase family protein [Labilithrix sp.]|nr:Acyl-CoA dehydrogenase family protein [Labilithrix sp.]